VLQAVVIFKNNLVTTRKCKIIIKKKLVPKVYLTVMKLARFVSYPFHKMGNFTNGV
jgi:hypothetical protein